MINLIVFDLDGVLVETRDMHFKAFNEALAEVDEKYVITPENQRKYFFAIPSWAKLKILTDRFGLPEELHQEVYDRKQKITKTMLETYVQRDERIIKVLEDLRIDHYKLAVGSNTVRFTLKTILENLGVMPMLDYWISGDDVEHHKPAAEMYQKCMMEFGSSCHETLVLEDSDSGKKAVCNSGAHLMEVEGPDDVTYDNIKKHIHLHRNYEYPTFNKDAQIRK